jgi:uncharacterized protein YraI
MFGFRRGSSCATFAVAAVAALLLLAALAGSALAISAPIHIAGTAGEGVYIRSEPSTSGARLGWMPEGASPDYNCFVWGQNINGVPIWFNVNYNGVNGYYASFYDDSSYHSNEELTAKYGVPLCGSAPAPAPAPAPVPAPPSVPAPAAVPLVETAPPVVPGIGFNRVAAVGWATSHVENTPPYEAACTWFISQALWAGGLAKTALWTSDGAHGHPWSRRPGTGAAWAAPLFIGYILHAYPHSTYTEISLRGNKVPAAEPGDVIAYDWEGKSGVHDASNIDHLSLVTRIASGQYPEVAEWSIYSGTVPTPYVERGWTWSQKSHKWLQQEYPKVQAFLLHINPH